MLPLAAGIDVAAKRQNEIEQLQIVPPDLDGGLSEVEQGRVDLGLEARMPGEQIAHGVRIAGADSVDEQVDRCLGQRVDLVLELGPARETVGAGDDQLGIAQLEPIPSRRFGVQRLDTGNGLSLAAAIVAHQGFGELLLFFKVGLARQGAEERTTGFGSVCHDVPSFASCPASTSGRKDGRRL